MLNDQPIITSLGRDSTITSVYDFPALSKSPSWLPLVKYALPESNRYETHVTTLDNGLRVCSEKFYQININIFDFLTRWLQKNFSVIFVLLEVWMIVICFHL